MTLKANPRSLRPKYTSSGTRLEDILGTALQSSFVGAYLRFLPTDSVEVRNIFRNRGVWRVSSTIEGFRLSTLPSRFPHFSLRRSVFVQLQSLKYDVSMSSHSYWAILKSLFFGYQSCVIFGESIPGNALPEDMIRRANVPMAAQPLCFHYLPRS